MEEGRKGAFVGEECVDSQKDAALRNGARFTTPMGSSKGEFTRRV